MILKTWRCLGSVVLCLGSAADVSAQPIITMSCSNSRGDQALESKVTNVGKQSAYADLQQFNIERDPGDGTIHVTHGNDGVCTVSVETPYKIVDGGFEYALAQTWLDPAGINGVTPASPPDPWTYEKTLCVSKKNINDRAMEFHLQEPQGSWPGNIGILFRVDFIPSAPAQPDVQPLPLSLAHPLPTCP